MHFVKDPFCYIWLKSCSVLVYDARFIELVFCLSNRESYLGKMNGYHQLILH